MVTATLYLALGVLGLSFAVAPGYASPIFPAAGFAVASMLYSNGRSWPGVWAGSLALNLVVAWWHNDLDWHSSLIAAGIAVGTTLQVLVARRLVVHSVKNGWQTLQNDRDIILCLALAGPVACVVSATVGVSVIYASQSVSTLEYLHAWWNWWIGDTLGVLVILPLSLTLLYWRQPPWRGRLTILVPPMLVTLTLVGAAFVAVAQWETSQRKQAIRDHGEALAKVLEQRFSAHQEALAALRRLLEVSPDMIYGQFEYFTHITLKDNPDIFALSINPYVLQPEREAFERRLAVRTGTPGFEINEMNGGQRTRAAERAEYVPIGFIAPLEGNRSAIGYDIDSEPARRDAIQRARQSRAPAITAPLRLVQEEKQRVGVLIMLPAYSKQDADSSSPNDGSGLIGFAVGVIKVDEMVEIATRSMSIPGLVFTLSDEQASAGSTLIHHSNPSAIPQEGFPAWHKPLKMGDRAWTLQVFPAAESLNQKPHWAALAVAASGLVLATLLQILLLGTTGRSAVIERKVQEQTAELQAQRDALEDRNAQLLDSEQRFRMLFVHLPVAYQALDSEGRWLDANQKMADLLGFAAPEQMRGLNFVDYCSDDSRSQFNESFERFKRTLSAEEQRTLRRRDGQAVTVLIVGRIQRDTKGNFMRAHCILADISERQAMERVLSKMTEATLRHLGQELHDDLGQILSGSAMLADTLAHKLSKTAPGDARAANQLRELLNEAISKTRALSHGLYPVELDEAGLAPMLRVLAQRHDTRSRLRAHFVERGTALELRKEQALNLYRIVQGAVSNVTRHSGASRMDIELDWHADWLQITITITITDNGIGLENDRRRWREKGIGLSTMQHRAAVIGAGLKIGTPSHGGTRVMLTLQLTPAGAA